MNTFSTTSDKGVCCFVSPNVNFNLDLNTTVMSGEEWHKVSKGAQSGTLGGLKLILDTESFDSAWAVLNGVKIAFTDQRDLPVISHEGYLVSPGEASYFNKKYFLDCSQFFLILPNPRLFLYIFHCKTLYNNG